MLRSLALSAALLAGALAPAALAQDLVNYSFMPPQKVQDAMEKDHVPGIFIFQIPGDVVANSINWNFTQAGVVDVLEKYHYAACKIAVTDARSTRPWGAFQKLADEWGVTPTTTLMIVSYDRKPLAMISQILKRDDFAVYLGKKGRENLERLKASEQANTDLTQIEKWIEEKKLIDANRRLSVILKKEKILGVKTFERAKEVDGKLETAGKARLDEGKALLDGGNAKDAKPILEDVATGCARFECGKEAKELLKKAKS